jgi:hypothetical protein
MKPVREWSLDEIDAAFRGYIWMYRECAAARPYVKQELIRELQKGSLALRSRSSIERRFQNFSWIFQQHGLSYVPGFVPLSHVGRVVEARVADLLHVEGVS